MLTNLLTNNPEFNYDDVDKGYKKFIDDPRFTSLKNEDQDELITHIKASIKMQQWEKEFEKDAKTDYMVEASSNEAFQKLKRIQTLATLMTYKYDAKRMREHIEIYRPYSSYSDKMLITELMNVTSSFNKEKATEVLQEISYRVRSFMFCSF